MDKREWLRRWASAPWMIEMPDDLPMPVLIEPFEIKPMTIQIAHGTIRPAYRCVGLADR